MRKSLRTALDLVSQGQGNLCTFTSINYTPAGYARGNPRDFTKLSCGDVTPLDGEDPEKADFFVWNLSTGSHYSGSDITRANFLALLDLASKRAIKKGITLPELGVWEVYGGYSTYAVAVSVRCTDARIWDAFYQCLDYPVLDEDTLTEVTQEAEDTAYDSYVAAEFLSAINETFGDDWDITTSTDTPALFDLFRQKCDQENIYWANEEGNTSYIDVAALALAVTAADVKRVLGAEYIGDGEEVVLQDEADATVLAFDFAG